MEFALKSVMQWSMSICTPSLVYSVGHKILKPICMTLACSTRDISHKFLIWERERERGIAFTYVRNYDHTLQLAKKHGDFRLDTKHPSTHNPYPFLFLPVTLSIFKSEKTHRHGVVGCYSYIFISIKQFPSI